MAAMSTMPTPLAGAFFLLCSVAAATGNAGGEASASSAPPSPSWHDTALSAKVRTEALLADLTLNEKVSLLQA